jgi:hypothetical protein
MDDALLKAQLEFQPVPQDERKVPGRIQYMPARFRIDEYEEHDEALRFLEAVPRGDGGKLLVRALLHFRDSVIEPLSNGSAGSTELLRAARGEFHRKEQRGSRKTRRVKNVSARLYIDKFVEHREAYEFLKEAQETSRDGNKMIVRALLHYRDTVFSDLEKQRARRRRSRSRQGSR